MTENLIPANNGIRVDPAGNVLFNWPHGSFSSNASITMLNTATAYAITYTTTDLAKNIFLSNSSRINIEVAGVYLLTYSAVGKSAAPNVKLDIWLSVGGSSVANSNTISRFVGSANERIVTVTYIYRFTAGQYFELYCHSDDVGTVLLATAAAAGPPAVPACPAIITTANKISN